MKHAAVISALAGAACVPSFEPATSATCTTCFDAGFIDAAQKDSTVPDSGDAGDTFDAGAHLRALALAPGISERHTCAVMEDHTLECWGDNNYGQLGLPNTARATRPTTVPDLPPVDEAVLGFVHTCARSSGAIYCWGDNTYGQVGVPGAGVKVSAPVRVGTIDDAVELGAGIEHTCARRANGAIVCWGNVYWNQPPIPAPMEIAGFPQNITALIVGRHMNAVLAGGRAYIFGRGTCYRLGLGDDESDHFTPTPMTTLTGTIAAMSLGEQHGCALFDTGALWCWGCNDTFAVGHPNASSGAPQEIIASGVTAVSAGYRDTCVERANGDAQCWGEKSFGLLADGKPQPINFERTYVPEKLPLAPGSHVVLHQFHACALDQGTVSCWGQGAMGQVGDGSLANTSYPITVIE